MFRVPSGPPARSPSAPRACSSARRLEARPGPAVPPAPSTLVAWVCRGRPGPAAALRHRGCGCVAGVPGAVGPARPLAVRAASLWLGASSRSPARPCGPAGTFHTALRSRRHPSHWWRGCVVGGQALQSRRHPPHCPAVPTVPSTLVARVCRGRPGPNVADPRPRRRITVHTTACAKM